MNLPSRNSKPLRALRVWTVLAGTAVLVTPALTGAQTTGPLPILNAEATPIGALPPLALPMPASRDHNYWGFRLQAGQRRERGGPEDLFAVAGGVDLQVRGGSIFGVTGGYQWRQNCAAGSSDCGHALVGARARFNLLTAGPTVASLWGDRDATTTVGTEVGLGFAPRILPGVNACTLDVGLPLSIATLERLHLVTFVTPGLVRDIDCSAENSQLRTSYLIGFGFGIQQLGFRGLDVHAGFQRMFRGATGLQFGLTVSWVRLP